MVNQKLVTVIIPVSQRHTKYLPDALASVASQSVSSVLDCAVVWDCAPPAERQSSAGGIAVRHYGTGGGKWTSFARNLGIRATTTPFVTFLDADDALTNVSVELMVRAYAMWPEACYIYGDAFTSTGDSKLHYSAAPQYDRGLLLRRNLHTVTALVPTRIARSVGGFDESLHGWEDWEFYIRLAERGLCGKRMPAPLITYRLDTGVNRQNSFQVENMYQYIVDRHKKAAQGEYAMGCGGGCGEEANAAAITERQAALAAASTFDPSIVDADGKVAMEYAGNKAAPVTYNVNGRSYAAGALDPFFRADARDVLGLEGYGIFRRMPAASKQLAPALLSVASEMPRELAPLDTMNSALEGAPAPLEVTQQRVTEDTSALHTSAKRKRPGASGQDVSAYQH